jgi:hypothetical protein
MLTYATGPTHVMAGLDPAICTGTAAAKMAGSDPRIRSGDGHDGFAVTPRLPGESIFSVRPEGL